MFHEKWQTSQVFCHFRKTYDNQGKDRLSRVIYLIYISIHSLYSKLRSYSPAEFSLPASWGGGDVTLLNPSIGSVCEEIRNVYCGLGFGSHSR